AAVLLPALASVRTRAADVECLGAIAGSARAIAAYAGDHPGRLPHFAEPAFAAACVVNQRHQDYFAQQRYWPTAVRTYFADGRRNPVGAHCPGAYDQGVRLARRLEIDPETVDAPTVFTLPDSLLTDRAYWSRVRREIRESQLRPAMLCWVGDPSRKTLLVETTVSHREVTDAVRIDRIEGSVAFVDGHARSMPRRDLTTGLGNPMNPAYPRPYPGLHTPDGAAGRDVP